MRKSLAFLLAILATHGTAFAVSTVPIPAFALSKHEATPLWVSASIAIDNGTLRPEFFEPAYLQMIEDNQAANRDQCVSYISLGPIHTAEGATIDDRVTASYSVVAGKISRGDQGFYRGTPGTLFQLDVASPLKSFGHSATSDVVYLFIASADIATPRGRICAVPLPGTLVPQVGDRVIAFAQLPAQDEDRQLILVNSKLGLIIERDRSLVRPVALKDGPAKNFDAVLIEIGRSEGLSRVPERKVR